MKARYEIEKSNEKGLIIRDIGPWDKHMTITNDVEAVVADLLESGKLRDGQRLHYFDSLGDLAEIVVENRIFVRFAAVKKLSGDYYIYDGRGK